MHAIRVRGKIISNCFLYPVIKMSLRLPESFYNLATLELARELIGCRLISRLGDQETSGIIVETEAYRGDIDEASHCFFRRTPRNEVMFWEPGFLYVYKIYGMHHCINVVSEAKDTGAAVLIRALRPETGIVRMQERRNQFKTRLLTSGPGKLAEALGITTAENGIDLRTSPEIFIETGKGVIKDEIVQTTRIGISRSVDLPWRFYLGSDPFVSRR